MNKGNLAVASLNAFLIRIRNTANPTIAQRQMFREQLAKLDKRITSHLRSDGPDIEWDSYPIARTWFTQNIFAAE